MNGSFVAVLVAGFAALPAIAVRNVDLSDARALEAIRADNPAQYEKVMGILEIATDVTCETLPQMLKVQYGATNVECNGALILTSLPAKRHLSFRLDDTAFTGNVVISGKQATLHRAKPSPPSNRTTPLTPR